MMKDTYAALQANPDTFKGKVVRELVDISVSDRLAAALEGEGTTLKLVFRLGVDKDVPVEIQVLLNGQWTEAVLSDNNNDGTVDGIFEAFCPVVFLVPGADDGGAGCGCCWIWLYLLLITICLMLILLIILWYIWRRKKEKEEQEQIQDQPTTDPGN